MSVFRIKALLVCFAMLLGCGPDGSCISEGQTYCTGVGSAALFECRGGEWVEIDCFEACEGAWSGFCGAVDEGPDQCVCDDLPDPGPGPGPGPGPSCPELSSTLPPDAQLAALCQGAWAHQCSGNEAARRQSCESLAALCAGLCNASQCSACR